jgi:ParB family chromosome partitioning protein
MARGLFEKAGRIQLPPSKSERPAQPPAERSEAAVVPVKPKTAPGTLMGFMANQSGAIKENELLREQAARFEGAIPTRQLDPRRISASRWANRHASSFDSPEFTALRAEILDAGGNVQPIKVRPLAENRDSDPIKEEGVGPSNPLDSADYEIVFGHRRHRACLELGLPVLCLIEQVSERELFVQMERENRNRADLSAWEQGVMYAQALDGGLYPSNRQLATSIGRDLGDVGRALSLARLPAAVIDAFQTPLDLQFRWAKPLSDMQQSDPEGLLARANALKGLQLSAKDTFVALIDSAAGQGVGRSNPPEVVELKRNGEVVATVAGDQRARVTIKFLAPMDETRKKKLLKLLESFI